jgi:tetratricopeptide (TPR) repeat protein
VAVAADPADYHAACRLAQVLTALGRLPEAAVCYQNYLAQEPRRLRTGDERAERRRSQDVRILLGFTLRKSGAAAQAADTFQEARAADPRNPTILLNLGLALGDAGRHPEALAVLLEAAKAAPGQAIVHRALAQAFARTGHAPEARAAFRTALALQPDDAESRAGLKALAW